VKPYYQDDLVTLYHADCLEMTAWLSADVLVTDPPYGIRVAQYANVPKRNRHKAVQDAVANDHTTEARDTSLELWGSKPAIVFGSWRQPRPERTKQRLIWHKVKSAPGLSSAPWYSAEEEIYIIGDGFLGKAEQNVYQTSEARMNQYGLPAQTGHPTPKPVGLMERLIAKCPEGVIADPFAGSGATLIAARNLGRKAIGVELEEKYCETVATRLSQQAFDLEGLTI
jgi:DNA modification methylase